MGIHEPARLDRRAVISGSAGVIAALAGGLDATQARPRSEQVTTVQTGWTPVPVQHPAREEIAQLPSGGRLWFWDTGKDGEPVVLLHPSTGSGAIWGYQQPVLAAAGYRVIGYSRRGHYRSGPSDEARPGSAANDLHELVEYLGLRRFHLLGTAAGGFAVPDYALAHPERLLSITIASSLGGVVDPQYVRTSRRLLPEGFQALPADFRELGPSYRAANPEGVAEWVRLEHLSRHGPRVAQAPLNRLDWDGIERIPTRALLMTGDADLFMPPSRVREYAGHLRNARVVVIPEAGHSAYWEQPTAFNKAMVGFLRGQT